MAVTVSLTGDWLENIGNRRAAQGTITGDASYPTGGYSLTPANVGLGIIDMIYFNHVSGYVFAFNKSTNKLQVFVDGGNLPTVTVTGGQAAGPGLQITPDSNAGVLGKTAATTRTIPGATFGLTGVPANMVEVANTTNLSGVTTDFYAVGR